LLPQSDLNEWRKYDLHPKQVIIIDLVTVCRHVAALTRAIGPTTSHLLAALFFGDPTLAANGSQTTFGSVPAPKEPSNACQNWRSMKLDYT
jgi:hypothetical protein